MKFKRTAGTVACERLKCVMETEPFECSGGNMAQMKKEILECPIRLLLIFVAMATKMQEMVSRMNFAF